MSNKFLLFPFFGLLLPIIVFIFYSDIKEAAKLNPISFGEAKQIENEENIGTSSDRKSQKLVFVGDILLARHVEHYINTKGQSYPLKNAADIFSGANYVVGNFESAVLEKHIKTPSYITTFSVNKKYLGLLSEAGLTHVSLANNHSLDYGKDTFNYTVSAIEETGINAIGNPESVNADSWSVIKAGDYNIGLFAVSAVYSDLPWSQVEEEFKKMSDRTDFQIVYIHWGEEYILKHNQEQETIAKKLIDIGFDTVIGHHPHVTQDIEVYNDKPIFFSLGNFLFDQYFSVDVQQGLAVTLEISSSTVEYHLLPVSSEGSLSQPHKMLEPESLLFLKNLARRSQDAYAENIAQGKLILPFSLATSTQNGIIEP